MVTEHPESMLASFFDGLLAGAAVHVARLIAVALPVLVVPTLDSMSNPE
jgi:hypothetical protein